jgi:dolichol kinase
VDAEPVRNRLGAETARKLIHLGTIGIPVLVWFLPRPYAVALVASGAAIAVATEWARAEIPWVRLRFLRGTRRLLRRHERRRWSGATYLALAYLLATLVFPRSVAVAAMLYAGLGDAVAGLVGRHWGRHRVATGKSWEGAGAGMVVNIVVGATIPGIGLPAAIVGGLAAAAIEMAPLPLDDNLRVSLGGGVVLWLAVLAFGA